jgi:PAS domain S-box-containing protein
MAGQHRETGRPLDDLKRGIVAIAVAGLALLTIFRAVDLWRWRNNLVAEGATHAANLAHILADYLGATFAATDAALLQLQAHGRRIGGAEAPAAAWTAVLASTRSTLTGAGSISVADAGGVIRYSTQPVIVGQSRRSFFVFRHFAAGGTDEMAIDPPFRTISEPHHFVLPIARRLDRPDGSFGGMVVVVFEPSQLRPFFKSVDVGRGGEMAVLHPDGAVLYREPSAGDVMGERATTDPVLAAARSAPDGTLRERRREALGSFAALSLFVLFVAGGIVVALRQIDRRIAAEAALGETEERTRFALDAARVGTWEIDLTTGAANWSHTLEQMHGVEPGHFGRTFAAFLELVHPEDRQPVERTIQQATIDRTDADILYRAKWPDGTIRWMRGVGRTFCDESGAPVRTAGVSMDVTERHLLDEQSQQSQKLESIGQLAAGVAHDFNNLLTAILGHCDLLDETLPASATAAQSSVGEVRRASERAASLTRQLLAFGRRQMLAPRVLDLGASLTAVEPMLRRLIREDITIVVRVEPSLAHVNIDPGQVEQVIVNLALNARDAMPDGGCLTLELANAMLDDTYVQQHAGARTGRFAMLAVSDTGTGMDATTQARIFDPFFTTKEQGKGTGLGLATVYGIVKQSGGYIWVYSEPGQGSTFKVYLPAADAPVAEVPPSAAISTSRGTETILVVEDDSGVRALMHRILTGRGYRVLFASTPAEAIEIERTTAERIHLAISDVVLPEMSGPTLLNQLLVKRPDMRVLYVSGYTDNAVLHRGILEANTPFLPKPFTAAALLQKVRKVLAG